MAKARRKQSPTANHTPANSVVSHWFDAHWRCFQSSLRYVARRRLASVLTIIVIGITLALPTGLFVAAKNLSQMTTSWQSSITVSVYLADDVNGPTLARQLEQQDMIASTQFISADKGLKSLKQNSQLGPALDALGHNPLPAVIRVHPEPRLATERVQALADKLQQRADVERAQLDAAWVRRLNAIIDLASRAATVIAVLLGLAVVFIIGNTIGLEIENRRHQIEVMKLLGATDAFIRRPFIYEGVVYGLFGGIVGLIMLAISALALRAPLADLVAAYQGGFTIAGLSASGMLVVLGLGVALGWLGSGVSATRHLAAIEPR